jgi:hypothetical protein
VSTVEGRVVLLEPEHSKSIARALLRAHTVVRFAAKADEATTEAQLDQHLGAMRQALGDLNMALRLAGDPRELIKVLA